MAAILITLLQLVGIIILAMVVLIGLLVVALLVVSSVKKLREVWKE